MARSLEAVAVFAGVGGIELGLHRAGHRTSLFCESDGDASRILAARFPGVPILPDVRGRQTLIRSIPPFANLLTAGFPCQDFSQAGDTRGFEGNQSVLIRDLLSVLEDRPFLHVLLENVPNWRTLHGGAYLAEVITTLEGLGYRWAYRTIDARAFGLPQRRLRIFLYASPVYDPRDVLFHGDEAVAEGRFALDAKAHGFYWTEGTRGLGWGEDCTPTLKGGSGLSIPSPPAILMPDGRIITPDIRDAERLQGLPINWTDVPPVGQSEGASEHRQRQRKRWLLVGNSVNVPVAAWIGARLAAPIPARPFPSTPLSSDRKWPQAAWGGDGARWSINVSTWPVSRPQRSLDAFLRFPGVPLSWRATRGFFSRVSASSLRFRDGFREAVADHLTAMADETPPNVKKKRSAVERAPEAIDAAE